MTVRLAYVDLRRDLDDRGLTTLRSIFSSPDPETALAGDDHLHSCALCQAEARWLTDLGSALRSLPSPLPDFVREGARRVAAGDDRARAFASTGMTERTPRRRRYRRPRLSEPTSRRLRRRHLGRQCNRRHRSTRPPRTRVLKTSVPSTTPPKTSVPPTTPPDEGQRRQRGCSSRHCPGRACHRPHRPRGRHAQDDDDTANDTAQDRRPRTPARPRTAMTGFPLHP